MAPLVGLGGEGTAVPMAIVIMICGIGAAVALEGLASGTPRRVVVRSETPT